MGVKKRIYFQSGEFKSFKSFKWVLKGRWNQGTGNYGSTRTYLEWDELGISYVGSNGVKYGPTYWTVDSYSSSGDLFADRPASEMFDGEWGSETSKSDYKNIDDTDGYVEIIIHTTSGEAITPNGVGLISCNNQANYSSSTPAHFILYGLDEGTNEYVQIVDVPASDVNKGNNSTTVINFSPIGSITISYLLAPPNLSKGSGLRYEIPEIPGINLLPMTTFTWPSMSNGCFTITDNNVNCFGITGFRELLYKTFTVDETSDYLFELDWTSQTGLTLAAPNDSYWNRFGIYIDTSLNVNSDQGYQGAMSQGIIMQRSDDTSVITKSQTATVSLVANTTYYLWLSYSILADNRNQNIDFTKMQLTKV